MPKGKMPPVPEIQDSLLVYLNYMYPNELPSGEINVPNMYRAQGTRDVVHHLEALRQKQSGLQPQ